MAVKGHLDEQTVALKRVMVLWQKGYLRAKSIRQTQRNNLAAVGRYVATWAGLGCRKRPSDVPNIRLPLSSYLALFRFVKHRSFRKATAFHRKMEKLYRQADELSILHPPTRDPLCTPSALTVNSLVIQRLFARLFDVKLNREALQVLAQYGTPTLAVRDFLGHCGYGGYLPSYAGTIFDIKAFVVIAASRHRERHARSEARVALGERSGLAHSFGRMWVLTNASVRDSYLEASDLLTEQWFTTRAQAYRLSLNNS